MAVVVITGGGVVGLSTAMLLARDGHLVTVLERDPNPPPPPLDAWDDWSRRGVTQFRLPHFLLARFHAEMARELPEVVEGLLAAGAFRLNPIEVMPTSASGGWRPGDERFTAVTGRRPLVESVVAGVAEAHPGVTVRRDVAVTGLLTAAPAAPGAPHVVGVTTSGGDRIPADLVVDAMGRRSPSPSLLAPAGGPAPGEEVEEIGFVYYGRHFAGPDGAPPPMIGPPVQECGSVTVLTLPADNGTWSVTVVTSARDPALRTLSDPQRWAAVVGLMPLAAHWLDGTPLDDRVAIMAKLEDRRRRFAPGGVPVVTGLVPVGDAWACTNPSLGRGASIGLVHAVALRDHLRTGDLDDPAGFAARWSALTDEAVGPWYEVSLHIDRHRLAEIHAEIDGAPRPAVDARYEARKQLELAGSQDPDLLRANFDSGLVLRTADDVMAEAGVAARAAELGADWRDQPRLGPTRSELLAAAHG